MAEIPFVFTEIIFALVWLICRICVSVRRLRVDWRREAVLLLMYVNLAVIIRFAFFPMERVGGRVQPLVFDAAAAFPFRINLIPFVRLSDYSDKKDMLLNVLGNAALFVPSGIVLPVVYRKLNSFLKVVGAGALISLCIEIIQLPFSVRATDVDDLIMNVAGVIVGYGIYASARLLIGKIRRGAAGKDR